MVQWIKKNRQNESDVTGESRPLKKSGEYGVEDTPAHRIPPVKGREREKWVDPYDTPAPTPDAPEAPPSAPAAPPALPSLDKCFPAPAEHWDRMIPVVENEEII